MKIAVQVFFTLLIPAILLFTWGGQVADMASGPAQNLQITGLIAAMVLGLAVGAYFGRKVIAITED